jgi:hypothetical protein
MKHSAEMRRCLIECDVVQMRRLDQHLMPHLAALSDDDVLTTIHIARTCADFLSVQARAYSHRWLLDRGLPSELPDRLRPRAERMYPRVVDAVGVASHSGPGRKSAFNQAIQQVMVDAAAEAYADGHGSEPQIVKARILEKRAAFKRGG